MSSIRFFPCFHQTLSGPASPSENLLSSAPVDEKRLAWIRGETGRDGWHDGLYHGSFHAVPFFQGDRIYIRSRDELICIGPRKGAREGRPLKETDMLRSDAPHGTAPAEKGR